MSDKHTLELDYQVTQSRKVKALTAENNRSCEKQQLLKRYMHHIRYCTGTGYIAEAGTWQEISGLTEADVRELERISDELDEEDRG